MDLEQARRNMITQQVRAWDVLDDEVLNLLISLPREQFVPAKYQSLAFADTHTPIGHGQFMWAPKEEGKIIQALQVLPTETVLVVGTGSGYLTALLAKLANHVYSVDILSAMTELAEINLAKFNFDNITLHTGDASRGWPEHAPYDVIVITGSVPKLPIEFNKQLNVGGRIFAVEGEAPNMKAMLVTRKNKDEWHSEQLYETQLPRLQNINEPQVFAF